MFLLMWFSVIVLIFSMHCILVCLVSAVTPAYWSVLYFLSLSDSTTLKIFPGDNVILPCYVPNDISIGAVMWTRSYLDSKYVFFYQSNESDPDTQKSPSLSRIYLLHTDMWNGQLSLYIVEATFAEIGTYECRVAQTGTNNSKAAILKTKPINTLNLTMGEFVEEINLLPGKQVQHIQMIFSFIWLHMKVVIISASLHCIY